MSETVIQVESVYKRYLIRHRRSKDDGIRHVIEDAIRAPLKWLRNRRGEQRQTKEEFWALKDISFQIKRGEVIGIIGRNGAGKSTLLKILSRITEPTNGRIRIKGRVASLLEVGSGFHPELTGRENVFLNGAILGMNRAEIRKKFDEIVAFAEVEKFLDTPVKRYSSGMYMRLAFAVAAHLEPEILIVDEVLAVGDAQFQKKCLGKMQEVSKGGRTILFVSHNMVAVRNLCEKVLLLDKGCLKAIGSTDSVVPTYLNNEKNENQFSRTPVVNDERRVIIENVEVLTQPQTAAAFECIVHLRRPTGATGELPVELSVDFVSHEEIPVLMMYSGNVGRNFLVPIGSSAYRVALDQLPLVPGRYSLVVWAGYGHTTYDLAINCYSLTVGSGFYVDGKYIENRNISVVANCRWVEVANNRQKEIKIACAL